MKCSDGTGGLRICDLLEPLLGRPGAALHEYCQSDWGHDSVSQPPTDKCPFSKAGFGLQGQGRVLGGALQRGLRVHRRRPQARLRPRRIRLLQPLRCRLHLLRPPLQGSFFSRVRPKREEENEGWLGVRELQLRGGRLGLEGGLRGRLLLAGRLLLRHPGLHRVHPGPHRHPPDALPHPLRPRGHPGPGALLPGIPQEPPQFPFTLSFAHQSHLKSGLEARCPARSSTG